MRLRFSRRIVWLAVLATLLHAFGPLVHAAQASPLELALGLCSTDGARGGDSDRLPRSQALVPDCPWCLSGATAVLLPAVATAIAPPPSLAVGRLHAQMPRAGPGNGRFVPFAPRAPPAG